MSRRQPQMALRACLVLLTCAVSGCGDSPCPDGAENRDHWGVTVEYDEAEVKRLGLGKGRLRTPEARTGKRDTWDYDLHRRLVLNLSGDDGVHFKSYHFPFGSEDAREQGEAIQALTKVLRESVGRAAENHQAGEKPLEGLLLHFDCRPRWRAAADCIGAALAAKVPRDNVQLSVSAPGTPAYYCLNLALRTAKPEAEPSFHVHIRQTPEQVTEVKIDGRTWSFPRGDAFEADLLLAQANRIWDEIEKSVSPSKEPTVVSITIDDGVRWAYVVKVMDIFLGRTTPTLTFPSEGFSFVPRG